VGRKEDYREAMEASYDVIKDANPEAVNQWDSFDDFFASDQGKEALKDPIGDPNSTEYSDLTGKELSDALIKKSQENMMTAIVESDPEYIKAKEAWDRAVKTTDAALAALKATSSELRKDTARQRFEEAKTAHKLLTEKEADLRKKLEASLADVTIVNFSEQCFLMANIFEFVNWKESNDLEKQCLILMEQTMLHYW